ncbi:MAG: metallophosphoesterase, partial [Armatimonadetes bacterium]|nr:metallophosphoesterase [Armatimonadota bacterium]
MSRRRFVRLSLGLLGGTGLYAATVGSHWVEVTRHRVPLRGLDASLTGLRVAQLTDFHHSPWVGERYLRHVVELTNALRPDVVALTGDFIDHHHRFAPSCARILSELRAPRGRYAVLGNHDHYHGRHQIRTALAAHDLRELCNRAEAVADGLYVAGLDDLWLGEPEPARP